jgi:hypothetical protein
MPHKSSLGIGYGVRSSVSAVGIAGQIGGTLSSHGHLQGVDALDEPPNALSNNISTICCTATDPALLSCAGFRVAGPQCPRAHFHQKRERARASDDAIDRRLRRRILIGAVGVPVRTAAEHAIIAGLHPAAVGGNDRQAHLQ